MGRNSKTTPDRPVLSPPRVVVRLKDGESPPGIPIAGAGATRSKKLVGPWVELLRQFPGLKSTKIYTSLNDEEEKALQGRAAADPDYKPVDFSTFFALELPSVAPPNRDDLQPLLRALRKIPLVRTAYIEQIGPDPGVVVAVKRNVGECVCEAAKLPSALVNNPLAVGEGYLDPAPTGIDARYAVKKPGGDGEGQQVIDLERAWTLDHEDLIDQHATCLLGNPTARVNSRPHGTAVLGIVCAVDNKIGCLGVVPRPQSVNVVSICDETGADQSIGPAIRAAAAKLRAGDVLLLEVQGVLETNAGATLCGPIEAFDSEFWAVREATAAGIIVVESGGNGTNNNSGPALDLDAFKNQLGKKIWSPGGENFLDSKAIIVSAATSGSVHVRLPYAPHGHRIDCYAWGENITTLYSGPRGIYTRIFGGTSGAAAIIAGAALAVQGRAQAMLGKRYSPSELRKILRDPKTGTAAATVASRIGVMPDLKAIFKKNGLD